MTAGLVAVLFVAAGMVALGAFTAAWRRELGAALAAVPLMFAGAGIAFAGVARFSATGAHELAGQEMAALLAVAALALVGLGLGIAGREAPR
jgi:NADH:ubiquinone oxidoreductase subunit K